jgi:ferredoxin
MDCTVDVEEGMTVLQAAHLYDIPLEGACEGALACSTCHVIVDPAWFDKLEPAQEDEEDLLGCQIVMHAALDGLKVTIPDYSINIQIGKGKKR